MEFGTKAPALSSHLTHVLSFCFVCEQTFAAERNTLMAGSTVLQENALSMRPMRRVTFEVPRNETSSGQLAIQCTSPTAGGGYNGFQTGGCSIIGVWLEPMAL